MIPYDIYQFTYRYFLLFEKWDTDKRQWKKYEKDKEFFFKITYIEELSSSALKNKLCKDELLNYHKTGKPSKLALQWQAKKSEYMAFFMFDSIRISKIFNRFYGAHPDTKTDFIIRIDAEKRKYELALYRYGLKEPQIIPEDVYQLLVFKNKFEDYRSENYNQERGAWIW